ncbi:hypothetical protein AUI06_04060 [archaeon 13_2_20CM_2_52_21]|nr:MAG: hypothetical protein AUI06_04060 [archaeon 13_2_20CM_2_52_21]
MILDSRTCVGSFMNKIQWLEWGRESFDKARSLGKPILLDITGSWCHWCHVMDDTSYSDSAVIDLVNKNFIPVRVDTDKRPDVNRRYNMGGWPTTAFLDNEGRIITGGTYIPPQQLREVLRSVLDFYGTNKGKVGSKLQPTRIPQAKNEPLSDKITKDIATTVAVNFDMDYGGFGFEPKFPHAEALEYALLRYRYDGEKEMLTVVTKTLDKMGNGGIYDQVEEGFFRYSTTRDWSIPHYEKMAEDNAKLLAVYLHAFQLTGKQLYRDRAEGIVKYVTASLSDSEHGGFFGSQDADEEYYKLGLSERKTRRSPAVDRTLYTNYNSLFISSLLLASVVLERPKLGKFAIKSLDRILTLPADGALPFHYWKEDEGANLKGLLVDYASLIHSLLDAYEFSGKPAYLRRATALADDSIDKLGDKTSGGFYDLPLDQSNLGELRMRDKPIDENSLMALGLLRLSWLLEKTDYATVAGKALSLFNGDYERYGVAGASYALALDSYVNGPIGITIIAAPKSKETSAFKEGSLKLYSGRRYVRYLDPAKDLDQIGRLGFDGTKSPVAYVCAGKICGPPVTDPSVIEPTLSSLLAQ